MSVAKDEVEAQFDPETMVVIMKEDYQELVFCQQVLEALEAAGVENWEGYDDAIEIYEAGLN